MKIKSPHQFLSILFCVFLLSACATSGPVSDPENDPWEHYNRSIHKFNTGFDKALLKPVTSSYRKIAPKPIRKGLGNFLNNLAYPNTILNLLLQGQFRKALISTERFIFNSTVGIFGIFDVASNAEIPLHDEDLGQTLAVWGWDNSRYFVLPLFGPSTVRDGVARLGNKYFDPVTYLATEENIWSPWVLDKLHVRIRLMNQEEMINSSYDPYTFIRDAWLQNREFKIYNGDTPALDYEAFLEN
ncbi:MAG: VacJ family lipoprotein [Xanthomonadales bacterium]|nr:VacJ family lipoprotein [Xanthomonadales bacterium]